MGLFFKSVKEVPKKRNTSWSRNIEYTPRTMEEFMGIKPHKRIIL